MAVVRVGGRGAGYGPKAIAKPLSVESHIVVALSRSRSRGLPKFP